MPKKSLTVEPSALPISSASPTVEPVSATFQEAYDRLQDAVQTVRQAPVEDLDTLVACVKQGAEAHAVCKARIQAVRALLAEFGVNDATTSNNLGG